MSNQNKLIFLYVSENQALQILYHVAKIIIYSVIYSITVLSTNIPKMSLVCETRKVALEGIHKKLSLYEVLITSSNMCIVWQKQFEAIQYFGVG